MLSGIVRYLRVQEQLPGTREFKVRGDHCMPFVMAHLGHTGESSSAPPCIHVIDSAHKEHYIFGARTVTISE